MQETVRAKSALILSPLPNVVAIVLEFASKMCKAHCVSFGRVPSNRKSQPLAPLTQCKYCNVTAMFAVMQIVKFDLFEAFREAQWSCSN